jgi:hypothetical protein
MHKSFATLVALSLLVPAGACRRQQAPLTPAPPEWLDTAVTDQAKQHAPDAEAVGEIYKGTAFREGDRTDWQVTLEGGRCYWFSSAGDQTVEELSLYLWDPTGERVSTERGKSPRTVLSYCTPPVMPGLYKVQAKVEEGHGHYALGIYGKAAPQGPAPAPVPAPAAPKGPDLGKVVDDMAKATAPEAERVGEHFSGEADKTDWYVALETGKCYWFIGAGAEDVKELWLYLWDPADKRITVNKSENNRVTVGHCPTSSGMYHFQAKVNSGEGKYKVGVFAKKK